VLVLELEGPNLFSIFVNIYYGVFSLGAKLKEG